jgi:hypothetical protein
MVDLIKNLYQRKAFNRIFMDNNVRNLNLSNKQIVDIGGAN